jgi:hypothetical protein
LCRASVSMMDAVTILTQDAQESLASPPCPRYPEC